MEARVSGASLADALVVARKVVDDSLPNLIKVSSFPGYVQVQATNLETYLTIWVPAETLEEGEVCVYAEGLRRVMKEGEELRLFTKGGHQDEAKSGLSLVSVEEFPSVEEIVFQIDKNLKLTAKRVKNRKVETIKAEINAEVEGQALDVAFNPKLLKEFTKANRGTVEILLTADNHRPAVFKLGEDFLYLLMPKRT